MALVLVLGFLSVLMLFSVTFAILTRTERLVARSSMQAVQAGILLDAALAQAFAAIELQVGSTNYPDRLIYLSEGSEADILDGLIWDFIPAAMDPAHPSIVDHLGRYQLTWRDPEEAGWIQVTDNADVAFFAIDSSGFLDAHKVFQAERRSGIRPRELAAPVGQTGYDFVSMADGTNFATRMSETWQRLFTVPELTAAYGEHTASSRAAAFLFPFSFAPPDWDTIPVVLDQTDDGIYRYLDADWNLVELERVEDWDGNSVPDWVDVYRTATSLDAAGMGDMGRTMLAYWEEMLDESGAFPRSGPVTVPIPSNQIEGHLERQSRAMTDLLASHNIGRGIPIARDSEFDTRWQEERRFVRDYHLVSGARENNYRHWFPFRHSGLAIAQIWIGGFPAETHPPEGDEEEDLENWANIEVEIEYVNLLDRRLNVTRMFPSVEIIGEAELCPQSRWHWSTGPLPLPDSYALPVHRLGSDGSTARTMWYGTGLMDAFRQALGGSSYIDPGGSIIIRFGLRLRPRDTAGAWRYHPGRIEVIRAHELFNKHRYWALLVQQLEMGMNHLRVVAPAGYQHFLYLANDPGLMPGGPVNPPVGSERRARVIRNPLEEGIQESWQNQLTSFTDGYHVSGRDGTWRTYFPEFPEVLGVDGDNPYDDDGYPVFDSLSLIGRQPLNSTDHWRTIPMLGPEAVDAARYFSITHEPPARTGRISINSPFREVLAAGFLGANTYMFGTNSYAALSQEEAFNLADLILDHRPRGGYTNVVDAWRSAPLTEWAAARDGGNWNKFEVEEIVARSVRLFTARQQIFTIFLAARQRHNLEPVAESRAVAVVWRDPYRTDPDGLRVAHDDPNGRHQVRLLSFSLLDE